MVRRDTSHFFIAISEHEESGNEIPVLKTNFCHAEEQPVPNRRETSPTLQLVIPNKQTRLRKTDFICTAANNKFSK